MSIFHNITSLLYVILLGIWSFIAVYLSVKIFKSKKEKLSLITLYVVILFIALCKLLEYSYYGLWYSAEVGIINAGLADTLFDPRLFMLPKIANLLTAGIIVYIITHKWFPVENVIKLRHREYTRNLENQILEKIEIQEKNEVLIKELQKALNEVKTLSGFIPICANCKRIRDDKGYWNQLEQYIEKHSDAEFSHGFCPECAARMKKEYSEITAK